MLAGALGNLIPLSQRVNSSLQNDSFYDKKTTKAGRRGYENGCHSEIEVAKYNDWTAENIYTRSKKLLEFMENRWEFSFNSKQLDKLVYVNFAVDGRTVPEELSVPEKKSIQSKEYTDTHEYSSLDEQQKAFWVNFVKHCNERDREDIVGRKPLVQNWYDIPVGANDFLLQFTITRSKYVSLVIYAFDGETFKRLESKKSVIEKVFGNKFDWYSSREKSTAKRIVYKHEADTFNPGKQEELFDWMIEKFDSLVDALVSADELDNEEPSGEKFSEIKKYLKSCGKSKISLTFAEVENIIGTELCRSAYTYPVYWKPSKTHTMANTIVAAGYEVISVDLTSEKIDLEKRN